MDYQLLETMEIKGSTLVIKDSMIMLGESEETIGWPFINIKPNTYEVKGKFDDDEGIYTNLIVLVKNAINYERGKKLGEVDIDHGSIGLIDYDIFMQEINEDYENYEEWTSMDLDDKIWFDLHGKVDFKNATLTFVKAGDGDGSYPVYELISQNRVVGLECDFEIE